MKNTKLLSVSDENIQICGKILREGALVAFPTETVYGLGANALDKEAVANIYKAKGRPSDNPMIVHIASKEDLYPLVETFTENAKKLIDGFWPGPLTIILKAKDVVPKETRGGLETVAVRMPENEIALKLISKAGVPIAAPSANTSGRPSPTKWIHVKEDLDGKIDAILQGEDCNIGVESTVIDCLGERPIILRPGSITKEEIEEKLGIAIDLDKTILKEATEDLKPKSPGMKYRHYAPKAPMIVLKGSIEAIDREIAIRKKAFEGKIGIIFFKEDTEKAAHDFYSKLREMDKEGVDLILAGAVKNEGIGLAVMNRMLKSAAHEVINLDNRRIR